MKDLIIQALNVVEKMVPEIPKTKKVEKTISIENVKPIDIPSFMKENNVPDDAELSLGSEWEGFFLSWYVEVPLSESEMEAERAERKRRIFSHYSFKTIYNLLTQNGYNRVGVNTALLVPYSEAIIYEMFLNKDYNGLVKYYSLYFKKDLDN